MASQELEQLIAGMRMQREVPPPATAPTMSEQRAGFETMMSMFPLGPDVKTEAVTADGVKAEWIATTASDPSQVTLYVHGGGYVLGSIATHRELVSRIVRASGGRALSLDYRLAPEDPFPAAVDDTVTAYRWLLAQGVAPARVAIAGDSAGGGLALAALVAIREAGLPPPGAAACLSPWTDLASTGDSMQSRAARDPMLQKDALTGMASGYLNGADPKTPLASPLYADLAGLPPLYVTVGGAEVLYDDASRLVDRAKAAGVEVTFEPLDEGVHVWQLFAQLPEARESTDKIGAFIKAKTAK